MSRVSASYSNRNLNPADDRRIREIEELVVPVELVDAIPASDAIAEFVCDTRAAIANILSGTDDRLLVIVGPCSIHDPAAALEYAGRLAERRRALAGDLEIVMRVYFEKPRTTVGWKGLINDPNMDGSFAINDGLRLARTLLRDVNALGLPAGTEFLDTITPQYLADLVSWGAIGARTTESQIHRELASGLSCPVGFKNGTDGNVAIAIDAMKAAAAPHRFLSVTKEGRSAIVATAGNPDTHVILRGGREPNYDAAHVARAEDELRRSGVPDRVMVDASHGNSRKDPENQIAVCADVARQVAAGDRHLIGVMVESHLVAGRQDHTTAAALRYGQSVTDACLDWDRSSEILDTLARASEARRRASRRRGA